jgi:hypothetical protein
MLAFLLVDRFALILVSNSCCPLQLFSFGCSRRNSCLRYCSLHGPVPVAVFGFLVSVALSLSWSAPTCGTEEKLGSWSAIAFGAGEYRRLVRRCWGVDNVDHVAVD